MNHKKKTRKRPKNHTEKIMHTNNNLPGKLSVHDHVENEWIRLNCNLIEDALRKCEEKNRILLQKIHVAIIIHDVESNFLIANPMAQELLGVTEEELKNKKPDEFEGIFFYEDGSVIPPEKRPVAQVILSGKATRDLTVRIRHPGDKNDIWVVINADPVFNHANKVNQVIVTFTDITDRKKAEKALEKSQENLNFTLKAARIGFWEWDIGSDTLQVNSTCYTMLGYQPKTEPESQKTWIDRVHPEDRGYINDIYKKALSHNLNSYQYEVRFLQADGTYRWIQSKGFGFEYDENGMATRLTGIRTDIHERKLAEQERLATIRFFKSMDLINQAIRGTNDLGQVMSNFLDTMISIFDADRALLVYPCDPNASFFRIPMERAKPEFLGNIYIKKIEIPATKAISQLVQKLIDANGHPVTFGKQADYPLDEEFTRKFHFQSFISMAIYPKVDKPWNLGMDQCSYPRIWTQDEINLFQEIGRRLGDGLTTLLMFRNLQESEAKYRRIVDTTNEGIWMINENNITTFVNKRMAEIVGYQIEELMDHSNTDFMFDEDVHVYCERIEILKKGDAGVYEQPLRHKDGHKVWSLLSATPVFDENGNYTGSFGMLTDITQKKATEERLRKKEEQLRITLEAGHVGIWEWDVINDLVYATPVFYTMLGYEPKTEPGNMNEWLNRVHPQDRGHVAKQFKNALSRNVNEYQYDARFRQADGTYRWIQSKGFSFERDQHGLVARLTGIRLDINDRKSAEQEHLATIHFFKSMDRINQAIRGTNDLEQMMSDVLDTMLTIFDSDRAFLSYPCDPQASDWYVPMIRTKPEFAPDSRIQKHPMNTFISDVSKKLIDAGESSITLGPGSDYELDENFAREHNFLNAIFLAVYPKIDPVWVLGMHQCTYARVWTEEEKILFQEIGRRLGDGLTTLLIFRTLQKNEAKYRRIIDTSREGIWMINEDSITTYVNKRMAEMLGYREEEMINHSAMEFFFEEDVADHKRKVENRQKGFSETYERRHRHKNGQTIWTLVSATPLYDDENHFKGSFAMFTDITQRKITEERLKKSEAHLRITLDAAQVGIWEWDIKNNRLYTNPVYFTMLGYKPEIESAKKMEDWLDWVHKDERDNVRKILRNVHSPDFKEFKYEARFLQADGTYKWIQSKGFAFERDKNGMVEVVIGTRIDIHDRKIAEQEHLATIRFFKSMDRINQAIRGTNDLEQMMSDVLDTMISIFDADRALFIYPCDPAAFIFQIPMERAKPGFYGEIFLKKLEMPWNSAVAQQFEKHIASGGRPSTFGPEADYPLDKELTKKFHFQSQLSMAVYPKVDKPWDLSMDQCSYPRVWTQEDKNLFQEIGRRLGDGLSTLLMFRNLQESEAKYRRIVDTTNEGIWMLGEDYKTTFVNARIADMLGYTVEEIESRSPVDFVCEGDLPIYKEQEKKRKQGFSETYERCFRHKNGNLIYALISSTPILDNQKKFKGSFAMLTDITQRKIAEEKLRESEERLRFTLEAAQIGIWDWDLVNNLWYSTPYSYTALGYEPKYEPVGFNEWLDMMHPDDQKMIKNIVEKVYLSQIEVGKKYEVRYKYAGGGYRWMMIQGFIVNRDRDGRITRMVGVRIDIDERKRAEEELKKYHEHLEDLVATRTKELSETNKQLQDAKEAAEMANRAKSRFLASMSHELRTPLNAILGYAQIFKLDATLNEHQKAGIEIMKSSGEHLLTLISDILDLSKIEANKIELHPFGIDFRLFLDSISDVIRIRAEAKPISVYFQIEPDIPQGIIADQTRLRQVLLNLLGNAIKFTDSGYIICRVSVLSYREKTEEIQSRQCTIRFEVKDTGTGIRSDQLEKIFAPFEQVRNVAASEGVGLGLAISRQLVQMMGGDILVESEFGKGSRFWFDLTFPTTDVSVPFKPVGKIITGYKGVRKKILIVDDRETNRQVLTAWFSQLGFDIAEAQNGIQAISMARQIKFDLILMDLQMPNMNGFDAVLKIREIPEFSSVVMIAMSVSMTNITDEQCKKAGFNDFLSKPVDLEKLSVMLEKHMRLEWIYEEKTTEEVSGPVILPPAEELNILHELILRGDMLQLSKRAQHIETLGKQYIPFARKLKFLADNFQEHRIEVMIEDALKK